MLMELVIYKKDQLYIIYQILVLPNPPHVILLIIILDQIGKYNALMLENLSVV
jgi:hypothetical protein